MYCTDMGILYMKQSLAPTLFLLYLPKKNKYTRLSFFGILSAYAVHPAYPELIGEASQYLVQLVDLRVLYARVTLAVTAIHFFHYLVHLLFRQVIRGQVPHDLRG